MRDRFQPRRYPREIEGDLYSRFITTPRIPAGIRPVAGRKYPERRREQRSPITIRTNRLINDSLSVEPAGSPIHMVPVIPVNLAKKGSVKLTGRILLQHKKVKVTIVRGRPQRIGRRRQSVRTNPPGPVAARISLI